VKNRARNSYFVALILLVAYGLVGCALTPNSFHSVELTPGGTVVLGQSGSLSVSAVVLNDTANGGVVFSASPAGIGTLTQNTTTTATYTAPANVTTETVVMIMATSVDYPGQSKTLTVKIEPPPVITTTSLPSATLNRSYSAPVTATGGVPPLKWTIASGSLPAGLSLASSTTDTVNITGKATTAGNSIFTVTVTDATGASNTSPQLNIVVSSLAFTTPATLPPGTVNTAYSTTFAASGGTSPYTFSLAAGATLPPGLSLAAGVLSGTPTTAGTYTFGVTVTDTEVPPAAVTVTFTLVIAGQQNLALLNGSYAFTFAGNNAAGYVAAAGTFTANGSGTITAGEVSYNSIAGSPVTYTAVTGTYTSGTDGRGTITFANSANGAFSPVPTYAFAIDPGGSGHGRLIEFDSSGVRGSGRLEAQTVTTCVVTPATTTYTGYFAFGETGFTNSTATGSGPIAFAGTFFAAPPTAVGVPGSIGPGELDANLFGTTFPDQTLSGTYSSSADTNQCSFTITPQFASGNLTYSAYPVSSSEAFLVETDQASSTGTTPFTGVIDLVQQNGFPFQTQNTITGPMAGGLVGNTLSNGTLLPEAAIAEISVANSGAGNFDFLLTDNTGGSVTTNMAQQGSSANPFAVAYSSDQFGRVTTNLASPYFQPVLYLISPAEAFILTSNASGQQGQGAQPPLLGHLSPQSAGPFSAATLNGTYVEGSSAPATPAVRNLSGVLTLDGVSAITGTQDESTTAANTATEAVAGTYSVLDTADGTGSLALTSPAAFSGMFVIVSPTKFAFLTTTANDTNPILVVAGH
jgi:hypothetical protein